MTSAVEVFQAVKANAFYIIFCSYFLAISILLYYILSTTFIVVAIWAAVIYYYVRGRSQEQDDTRKDKESLEKISVCIVGGGASGICMAIKLKEAGIRFRLIEKEEQVGGTWYHNHYPGSRCDVYSCLYQFSFFQNPFWSCNTAPAPEIKNYLQTAIKEYKLERHITLGTKVKSAFWNDTAKLWTVKADNGEVFNVTHLVSGCGVLRKPLIPKFKGRERFEGLTCHSSRWTKDIDLKGKRVALIGTGASAVQIAPEIVDKVKSLHVFQRTPNWFFPKFSL